MLGVVRPALWSPEVGLVKPWGPGSASGLQSCCFDFERVDIRYHLRNQVWIVRIIVSADVQSLIDENKAGAVFERVVNVVELEYVETEMIELALRPRQKVPPVWSGVERFGVKAKLLRSVVHGVDGKGNEAHISYAQTFLL